MQTVIDGLPLAQEKMLTAKSGPIRFRPMNCGALPNIREVETRIWL